MIALALNAFFRTGLDWRRFTAADLELLRDASPGDCEEIFARQEIEAKGVLPE